MATATFRREDLFSTMALALPWRRMVGARLHLGMVDDNTLTILPQKREEHTMGDGHRDHPLPQEATTEGLLQAHPLIPEDTIEDLRQACHPRQEDTTVDPHGDHCLILEATAMIDKTRIKSHQIRPTGVHHHHHRLQ